MSTHDPENLNPCEIFFFLENLVAMRTHDPENINPCGKKVQRIQLQ